MVLNEAERVCAASLLRYVPLVDLEAIAETVTRGMVRPTSIKECVKIIIYHSDSPRSLLMRKKIKREILFKYLYDHNVLMTASMDKNALIDQVLKLWNNKASRYTVGDFKKIIQQDEKLPDHAAGAIEVVQKAQQVARKKSNQCINCPSEMGVDKNSSVAAVVPGLSIEEADELALKFSEWFYKLLNIEEDGGDKLGPEHFWQDCNIYMVMIFPSGSVEVMKQNSDSVVEALLGIKHEHKLYFNPNLSTSGIRGKLDPHGLVMVFACGTLHHLQNCVGVFEQMFLLARDTFLSNNWKVKSTKLRLRSSNGVESVPALQDESITQLLSLPLRSSNGVESVPALQDESITQLLSLPLRSNNGVESVPALQDDSITQLLSPLRCSSSSVESVPALQDESITQLLSLPLRSSSSVESISVLQDKSITQLLSLPV